MPFAAAILVLLAPAQEQQAAAPAPPTAAVAFSPGDYWSYRNSNNITMRTNRAFRLEVDRVIDGIASLTRVDTLPDGQIQRQQQSQSLAEAVVNRPLAVGYGWTEGTTRCSVEAEEEIAVPAGTFAAFRTLCSFEAGDRVIKQRIWYARQVGQMVKLDYVDDPKVHQSSELIAFKRASGQAATSRPPA